MASFEPVAGIVLAAGGATRFGKDKILENWHGEPLVRHVAQTALKAGLSPVVVVLGAVVDAAIAALSDLPVQIVVNPEWANGQSTSLSAGLRSLPNQVGAALFLLADQPQISARLIEGLLALHHNTLAAVVMPRVKGRRANPVLFDRVAFDDLLNIKGDTGGRAIMERYPVAWLDWDDESILLDIDTPEDYQQLLALANAKKDEQNAS
ncbi:MAG: nucleotidyltransferase family protein [Anaerolineae bacterium]|nr:nucleotidyltransferase family protein [Anaerolineae bacterium]